MPSGITAKLVADNIIDSIKAGKESAKGEGNFYALEIVDKDIFVTCNGDDTKGWISKIETESGTALAGSFAMARPTDVLGPKKIILAMLVLWSAPAQISSATASPKSSSIAEPVTWTVPLTGSSGFGPSIWATLTPR